MASQAAKAGLSLAGKVALVSGSSAGLGAAIARELSRRGASVVINYPYKSEESNADKVLASLGQHSKSLAVQADLSKPEAPRTLVEAAASAFGKIDILVNCAGINRPLSLDDADNVKVDDAWNSVMSVNAKGTFMLTREALKILSRKNSRIINMCSSASHCPGANASLYAGSKGLIEVYTRCWAIELPPKYGCTVNSVAPGPIGTEGFYAAPPEARAPVKEIIENTPVAPRVGEPSEVAWTVAMLCEEEAGWINGVYVPINGGSTIY